jgi:hypothetical protein
MPEIVQSGFSKINKSDTEEFVSD